MDIFNEDTTLDKREIYELYIRFQKGKTVRVSFSVWWWNLNYRIKKAI